MARRYRSRLARKETKRNIKRAIVFGLVTICLALALLFLGIPALIRMAIFLGNLRSSSQPVETGDVLPPAPPRLQPLPEATNSANLIIRGFSEPGSTVEIFLDGSSLRETVAETDGSFSVSGIKLSLGQNQFYAIAKDEVGNESQKSGRLSVLYDKTPPDLEIDPSVQGTEYRQDNNRANIKGKTEEDADVMINDRLVIVDSQGNFEYPVTLSEGENLIKVIASDKAGNQTETELRLTYTP